MHCDLCGNMITVKPGRIGTGYGETSEGKGHCYACFDRKELERTGKLTGYWTVKDGKASFGNWPGTLTFPLSGVSTRSHNWRTVRQHFGYFKHADCWYIVRHVEGGFTQVATAKRLRSQPREVSRRN